MHAQPGTAIYHAVNEGWTIGDHLAAEQLYETRKLSWRYTTVNFERGGDAPFPEPIARPGVDVEAAPAASSWETMTVDELIPEHVRELMREG